MVDGIDKTVYKEAVVFRSDVGLQRQHVRGTEFFLGRFQHLVDPRCAVGRIPLRGQQGFVVVRRDARVCGGNDPGGRIIEARQLVKRDVSDPVMFAIGAGNRNSTIAGGADGNASHGLVANVSIHVGIDDVLRRRGKV